MAPKRAGIGSHRQHLPNTVLTLGKAPYDEVYDGIDNANAQDKINGSKYR